MKKSKENDSIFSRNVIFSKNRAADVARFPVQPEARGTAARRSREHSLTCFDHNSSKSTNFSASRLSYVAARGDLAVGALFKKRSFSHSMI